MGNIYILISIAALIVILALLFFVREKGKQSSKPSNLAMIGMSLVVLGIIFGDDRTVGYSLIGVGVLVSVVDAIRNRKP